MPTSYWLDSTQTPSHPTLARDLQVDVAVVGGGVTGLLTALALVQEGASTVVLEAGRIGGGVTGNTTGKVTPLHGLVYDELRRSFGVQGAATYASAQRAGLARIRELVASLAIDCDLRDRPAYTYAAEAGQAADVEREAEAARAAGLAAELVVDVPLPYPVTSAVRLAGGADFHARKFALGLADAILASGGTIYERTPVTAMRERGGPRLETADGRRVSAGHVVVATLMPVFDRSVFWSRLTARRSYAIACRIDGDVPEGMFISAGSPTRSIRGIPTPHGELLLIGGEGHVTGEDADTRRRYAALERFARSHWQVAEVTHRWSAHDLQPADGVPYVGRYTPLSNRVWTAAGFRKWGFTNAAMASDILAAAVRGRDHAWADFFDPYRLTPRASAKGVAAELLKDARHFVGDRLRAAEVDSIADVPAGEARLVRTERGTVGAYRDDDGSVETVDPTCTHVGCRVRWNTAERSWDCPCHGSRFAPDGTVLQGPATRPLDRYAASLATARPCHQG